MQATSTIKTNPTKLETLGVPIIAAPFEPDVPEAGDPVEEGNALAPEAVVAVDASPANAANPIAAGS